MDTRTERVVLETSSHQIVGDLTMPREGYRSRLSDFLNRGDLSFIPLTDATIRLRGSADGEPENRSFVVISREHVQLAYPDSEQA